MATDDRILNGFFLAIIITDIGGHLPLGIQWFAGSLQVIQIAAAVGFVVRAIMLVTSRKNRERVKPLSARTETVFYLFCIVWFALLLFAPSDQGPAFRCMNYGIVFLVLAGIAIIALDKYLSGRRRG